MNYNCFFRIQYFFLIGLTLLNCPLIVAQGHGAGTARNYYLSQAELFENWLDYYKLDNVIEFHNLELQNDKLWVRLLVKDTLSDNVSSKLLEKLREGFEKKFSLSLEREIYTRLMHFMDVGPSDLVVEISDTYDLTKVPCVSGKMFFRNRVFQNEISTCRTQTAKIDLGEFQLKDELRQTASLQSVKLNAKALMRRIYDKSQAYFLSKHKKAEVNLLENSTLLSFKVIDARGEVLRESLFPALSAYEILTFIFSVEDNGDAPDQILVCKVYGKYGFGLFKPLSTKNGYRDMEPEYEEELGDYVKNFLNSKIAGWISSN